MNDRNRVLKQQEQMSKKTIACVNPIKEHDIYVKELNLDEFGEQLENLYNLYLAEMPEVSKFLSEILTEEEQKAWMQSIDSRLSTRHDIK